MTEDKINHPRHYDGGIECIDAMKESQGIFAVRDFCICNVFKYVWRFRRKNGLEDLKKARWYLDRAISINEEIMERMECQTKTKRQSEDITSETGNES